MNMDTTASSADAVDMTVLVTCYNESSYIIDTLAGLTTALRQTSLSFEVLVIDDNSKDDSAARVREYMRNNPSLPITLKVNPVNQGLANNYVDGAFLGRGKYYHMVCGDNAAETESLTRTYRQVGKADIIIPYQIQREVGGKPLSRRILSRVFTDTVNFLSGYRLKYYNGISVHKRYNVMRWHPVSYGFGFQADILSMLLDQGFSYLQIHAYGSDKKGADSSALSLRNFLSVCHTLLEISTRRVRRMLYGKDWPRPHEIHVEEETQPAAVPVKN
jgi:glycosyltransferase involved in cell wall biosynthesis